MKFTKDMLGSCLLSYLPIDLANGLSEVEGNTADVDILWQTNRQQQKIHEIKCFK